MERASNSTDVLSLKGTESETASTAGWSCFSSTAPSRWRRRSPGPSGEEYLTWRQFSREDRDVSVEGIKNKATKLPITDAHFRTGSAVMLPEGTAPSTEGNAPLTSVGALAVALRFNEDRPGSAHARRWPYGLGRLRRQ